MSTPSSPKPETIEQLTRIPDPHNDGFLIEEVTEVQAAAHVDVKGSRAEANEKLERCRRTGAILFKGKEWVSAESVYTAGLTESDLGDPHCRGTLLSNRAEVRIKLKNFEVAIQDAAEAVELLMVHPSDEAGVVKAWLRKVRALRSLRRNDEALDAVLIGLALDPVQPDLLRLQDDLLQRKKKDEADAQEDEWVEIDAQRKYPEACYDWTQGTNEATLTILVPKDTTKHDVVVHFARQHLTVHVKCRTLMDDKLGAEINPEESLWMLENGTLSILLEKREKKLWSTVMEDDVMINIGQALKMSFEEDEQKRGTYDDLGDTAKKIVDLTRDLRHYRAIGDEARAYACEEDLEEYGKLNF